MKIGTVLDGIRYTLSNENLQVKDEVFPIGRGRISEEGEFIFSDLDFRFFMTGFPSEPHIIEDLNYDNGRQSKAYQVKTNNGYSSIECYFKIIKMEEKKKLNQSIFSSPEWVKITKPV